MVYMGKSRKKLKSIIKEKFIMPYSLKTSVINTNYRRTKILLPILSLYGIFFFLFTILFAPPTINKLYHLSYYSVTFLISIITYVFTIILKNKFGKTNQIVKNIPMYFSLFCLFVISDVAFFLEDASSSALLSLFCLIVIILAVLYIEPIVFFIAGFFIGSPVITKFFIQGDTLSAVNFIILYFIFDAVSLFRWGSLKQELLHEKFITRQKEQLEKEIDLASVLQQNFYKQKNIYFKDWDIGYYFSPMMGVAGDLFDFYTDSNSLDGLGIYDISGHGISSGLLTMLVKNIIHNEFYKKENKTLDEILYKSNNRIIEEKGNVENYVTGILMKIKNNDVNFVVAGHPSPIVTSDKEHKTYFYDVLHENKPSIIGMRYIDPFYRVDKVSLSKNDQIVLYTDGILDLKNKEGLVFGKQKLLDFFAKNSWKTVEEQIDTLKQELANFKQDVQQNDDITVLILKRK